LQGYPAGVPHDNGVKGVRASWAFDLKLNGHSALLFGSDGETKHFQHFRHWDEFNF
jgi:hypothetical protein